MNASESPSAYKDSLRELRDAAQARLEASPDSAFARMQAQNLTQAFNDLEHDDGIRDARRNGELLEFRLIGPQVESGSVSLEVFFKIAEPFYRAVKYAAHRIRYGFAATRVPEAITDLLNLKLAGLTAGSARLLITGNAVKDLTGESLLQNTYLNVFQLLQANEDDFYPGVDSVGIASAQALGEMVNAVEKSGLAADLTWLSPTNYEFRWDGRPSELMRISAMLHSVHEPIEREETVSGEIAGILDTGRMILRTDQGKTTIRFSKGDTALVQKMAISTHVSVRVMARVYFDELTKRDVFAYTLLGLEEG
jgi:hypothetical protein